VANLIGHYTGTINSTAIGSSLTNNALIIGNTSTQANITATTLAIGNTSNAYFYVNSTAIGTPTWVSNSTYLLYNTAGSTLYASGSIQGGSVTGLTYLTTDQRTIIAGAYSLTSTSAANTDYDLSGYISASPTSYNFIKVMVFGQYIANTAASQNTSGVAGSSQSHLFKSFEQAAWANVATTFVVEGGTVTSSYNGDVTNFPAGAINAAKVLLVAGAAGSGQIFLRLIQRTTPATASATYYAFTVDILKY
jgi:hypothetical protein